MVNVLNHFTLGWETSMKKSHLAPSYWVLTEGQVSGTQRQMIRTVQPSIFCNCLFSWSCLLDGDRETAGWHSRCKKSHAQEHSDGMVKKEVALYCARQGRALGSDGRATVGTSPNLCLLSPYWQKQDNSSSDSHQVDMGIKRFHLYD